MAELPFVQVDAFAERPFAGNPAAVMPLPGWLPNDVLQAIAAENNLSETAFAVALPPGAGAAYDLRWFTPTTEVALCGHATLAAGHVLIGDEAAVAFRTVSVGTLVVRREEGADLSLDLPDLPPAPWPLPDLAAAMGGAVAETLWRDGGYAVFVYPDADAVRALAPDFARLRALGNILCIATAPGDETDVVSRAFVPGAGVDEDPVTGSAHCVIAGYWTARLGRSRFTACQASARGGRLTCEQRGDRVILTGRCRTVIAGTYYL